MYRQGRGAAKDETEAAAWYRKAANGGDAVAQNNLGIMYRYGMGVTKDSVEAAKWFRRAADQGLAQAQEALSGLGLR